VERDGPHPTVRLAGRERPAFRVCGIAGLVAAACLSESLAVGTGLRPDVQATLIVVAVLTFLGLALTTKVVTGRETLIYYHHEIAVLVAATAATAALGAPVLRQLDATALGLGAFLAFGRLGCTRAGCCHGRPAGRRGIRYGPDHVAEGFPAHLVGVALVPVQLLEAGAVAGLVAAGAVAVAAGAAPGSGLVLYVTGYALLRFGLEWLRGDEGRRSAAGLSEAQWTSLTLLAVVAMLGLLRWVPGGGIAELAGLGACLVVALGRRRPQARMSSPAHVREIAEALGHAGVSTTSQGLRLSGGETGGVAHYTLSQVPPAAAATAAEVVRRLRHPGARSRLLPGSASALHVVIGSDERA
jgi:hypothetical protein